jgi:hypothetical protein
MTLHTRLRVALLGATLSVIGLAARPASAVVLMDSEGVVWTLEVIARDDAAVYLRGTADMGGGDIRVATASKLLSSGQIMMCAGPGSTAIGTGFTHNIIWRGGTGSGVWMAWDSSGFHGRTTVWRVDPKAEPGRDPVEGQDFAK